MNFVPIISEADESVVMLQKILQIRGFQVAMSSFDDIKESLSKCLLLFISSEAWENMPQDQRNWLTDRPTILITNKFLKVNELRSQNLAGFLRVPFENEALFSIADDLQYRYGENRPERSTIRYPLEKQCRLSFPENVKDKFTEVRAIVQDIAIGGFKAAITLEPGKSVEDLPPEGTLELPNGNNNLRKDFSVRWSRKERFFMTIGCQWIEPSAEFTDKLLDIIASESPLFFLNI
jgi:hypothetical protein